MTVLLQYIYLRCVWHVLVWLTVLLQYDISEVCGKDSQYVTVWYIWGVWQVLTVLLQYDISEVCAIRFPQNCYSMIYLRYVARTHSIVTVWYIWGVWQELTVLLQYVYLRCVPLSSHSTVTVWYIWGVCQVLTELLQYDISELYGIKYSQYCYSMIYLRCAAITHINVTVWYIWVVWH